MIVSNGSMTVEALGGDDLVCVTGYGAQTFAGDGDDVVDATALTRFGAQVRLGAGSDRFTGSAGYDVVWTGMPVPTGFDQVDTEVDVVDVGPAPASRVVRDSVRFYAPGVGAVPDGTTYDGGTGHDSLGLTLPDEVDLDLDRGRLSTGRRSSGATVPARRFEHASVMAADVELRGTASRNELSVYACRSTVEGRAEVRKRCEVRR